MPGHYRQNREINNDSDIVGPIDDIDDRYDESKFRLYRMVWRLILSKIAMKSIL
jgi:hypothetical protein